MKEFILFFNWLFMKGQHRHEHGSIVTAVNRKTEAVDLGNKKKKA